MVAAQKGRHAVPCVGLTFSADLARHVGHALDIRCRRNLEELGYVGDRRATRRRNQLRRAIAGRLHLNNWIEPRGCFFKIGGVPAHRAACNQVLARIGIDHELLRLRSAHRSRVRFDGHKLQPAARENLAVNRIVQVEAFVEASLVDIERIAVLHGELPHTQQARLGPRLIAKLGLDLVPDLRQLLVAAQLVARNRGHDLFVRHAQAEVRALAVLEAKHVVAHARPAPALLPRLARQYTGEIKLLRNLVHLLAHDTDDLVQ